MASVNKANTDAEYSYITTYKAANKMTYCTKCWGLGHLRDVCIILTQRCRICLGNFGLNHQCSNVLKCANCQLEHHSLDPRCDVIRRYRTELNKAVNMAICEGKLHRREIPQQQDQPTTFRYNNNDFPVMNTDKIKSNPWNIQNNNSDQ
ncbi:unnamed protein product [Didymodactylos carnosus]|uniref:Uncharacterized protein n=1 Tax=Didymodactylos carnosus TaxID=1234261 RepID=A0A814U6L6_9BILA|nr:unnamed protein product [Didymodactylos carnosus]CAF3931566.1 unnamed protein product [Didymodactylos carnosus]